MSRFILDKNDEPSSVKAECEKHGGKFCGPPNAKKRIHNGVEYEYKAQFDDNEHADGFLEEINAVKSDREFVEGYLTVFFSIHHEDDWEEETHDETPNAKKKDFKGEA